MNRERIRDLAAESEENFMRAEIARRASADPAERPNSSSIDEEENIEDSVPVTSSRHSEAYLKACAEVFAATGEDSCTIACFGSPLSAKGKAIWKKWGSPEN